MSARSKNMNDQPHWDGKFHFVEEMVSSRMRALVYLLGWLQELLRWGLGSIERGFSVFPFPPTCKTIDTVLRSDSVRKLEHSHHVRIVP